jgi:hypothetical protein
VAADEHNYPQSATDAIGRTATNCKGKTILHNLNSDNPERLPPHNVKENVAVYCSSTRSQSGTSTSGVTSIVPIIG